MSRTEDAVMTLTPGAKPLDDFPRMIERPAAPEPKNYAATEHAAESLRRAALVSGGRNPVFALLVEDDDDMVGLVAYALYKQSKRDWMEEFATRNGRGPTDEEIDSYILGERTSRRIATYRRLAADALDRFKSPSSAMEPLLNSREAQRQESPQQRRGFGEQMQVFLIAAGVGAVATLVAIYAAPRLLAG